MASFEDYLNKLISGVKSLFSGSANKPGTQQTSTQPQLSSGPVKFQCPVKGTVFNLGDFHPGQYLNATHPKGHDGVDLGASGGTPVYPMAKGKVINVAKEGNGGNVLYIMHPGNIKTFYAHLGTINVHNGDAVDNDTVVATVGASGNAASTFPHVHFQVWENGLQNPKKYFNVPPYNANVSKEKRWLSDEQERLAKNFNVAEHNKNKTAVANIKINYVNIVKNIINYLNFKLLPLLLPKINHFL